MKITKELLARSGSCETDFMEFDKQFPDGIDIMDAIADPKITIHMLHWGRAHLQISPEAEAAYQKRLKIENCKTFAESEILKNCERIFSSRRCTDCYSVFNSEQITSSKYVKSSKMVTGSRQIRESSFITNSDLVWDSKNVTNSSMVVKSNYVSNSRTVWMSDIITHCTEVFRSKNMKNAYGCIDSSNLNNCLFCTNLHEQKDYLFNRPADLDILANVIQQYHQIVDGALPLIIDDIDDVSYSSGALNVRLDKYWTGLDKTFIEWVQTIPGFDSRIMYQITLIPEFLK